MCQNVHQLKNNLSTLLIDHVVFMYSDKVSSLLIGGKSRPLNCRTACLLYELFCMGGWDAEHIFPTFFGFPSLSDLN